MGTIEDVGNVIGNICVYLRFELNIAMYMISLDKYKGL